MGMHIKDSGVFEALVETEVFCPKVVESALHGNDYSRGVRGMSIIAEAIQRIQYQQFFLVSDTDKSKPLLDHFKDL